jgi:hypothetical protein
VTPTVTHHPDTIVNGHVVHHPDTIVHHADTPGTPIVTQNSTATATESATAAFIDAADGTFYFSGSTTAQVFTAGADADAYNGGQEIIYNFSNIGTSIFTLNYDLTESYNSASSHNVHKLKTLPSRRCPFFQPPWATISRVPCYSIS